MNLELVNPLVWGVPCFAAMLLLELTYTKIWGDKDTYEWKDMFSSLGI